MFLSIHLSRNALSITVFIVDLRETTHGAG